MKKTLLSIFIVVALLSLCTCVRASNNIKILYNQPDTLLTQTMPLPILASNWQRIYIKNTGSFDLPPSMEIKKGNYPRYIDETTKIEGFDVKQITAQQKGLNELSETAFKKHARVVLETKYDSRNQFEELTFNIFKYTKVYTDELNAIYKDQITQDLRATSQKLSEWQPVQLERVNGMSCIHVSYISQLNQNPKVLVHKYIFQNSDRVHTLTLSYRLSEANDWESDFKSILKSFRIDRQVNNR